VNIIQSEFIALAVLNKFLRNLESNIIKLGFFEVVVEEISGSFEGEESSEFFLLLLSFFPFSRELESFKKGLDDINNL